MRSWSGWPTIGSVVLAVCLPVMQAGAATYSNVRTNMGLYVVRNQTDTWTRCAMVVTNGMVIESNAVVSLVASTNLCYLPVSATYRQTNFVGRIGAGTLWASNSLIKTTLQFYIGKSANGSVRLANSTFQAERDPSSGTFQLYVGHGAGSHTGELELVNSRLIYNSVSFGNTIWLGAGGCFSRLTVRNSIIGESNRKFEKLSSYGWSAASAVDQVVARFSASTVTVVQCYIGGDPDMGLSNGNFVFTNGSLLRVSSGKPAYVTKPGLYVGYRGGTSYTSTLTVAGSRVENFYPTIVGYNSSSQGRGRLRFSDNAVGVLNSNVVVGVLNTSRGFLDVCSGSRVYVTNTFRANTLTVGQSGYGKLSIDGGTCRVDRLYLPNGLNSVLALNYGMLSLRTGIISNTAPLVIGNGTGRATLDQWGGGTTTVYGAMAFTNHSRWRVDADRVANGVLDVRGTLSFAPGAALSLATTNATYEFMDGQTIGYANAVTTVPHVVEDNNLLVKIEPIDTRKALVLRYPKGTVVLIH